MVIYKKEGFITVKYDAMNHVIIFDWINFVIPLKELQELFEKTLKASREKQCFKYIAETSKVSSALRKDAVEWWGNVWVPVLDKAGLKCIITVLPQSAIANMSTRSWQQEVVGNIVMQNVKSLDDAIKITQGF